MQPMALLFIFLVLFNLKRLILTFENFIIKNVVVLDNELKKYDFLSQS